MNPQPKQKTHRDKKYRLWCRTQPCNYCGNPPMEGYKDTCLAHAGGGMAIKGNDKDGIILCDECHKIDHAGHETFKAMLETRTGKTWGQHAEENWDRYGVFKF